MMIDLLKRAAPAAIVVVSLTAPLGAQSPLVEAAKRTEAQRLATAAAVATKDAKKPADAPSGTDGTAAKTFTNKDLVYVPRPSLGVPAASPTAGAAATGTATVKDEAYWRARVAPFHQRILDNTGKTAPLTARIAALTRELGEIGPLETRRGGVESERQRLISEALALQALVDADVQAVGAIEDEGRRANALPAWFRPSPRR